MKGVFQILRSIFHRGNLNLVCVNPEKRMDGILFNPRRGYDHEMNVGNYTCPHCSQKIGFTTGNFDDGPGSRKHLLSEEDAKEFDRFRPARKKRWEDSLDFYCPGCNRPVRIIYKLEGEEATKGYRFEVFSIVEVIV